MPVFAAFLLALGRFLSVSWQVLLPTAVALYLVIRLQKQRTEAQRDADLHLRTIQALALAIDAKASSAQSHLRRLQVYAVGLGKALGVHGPELRAIETAALLHDIGKLAVPEHIVTKPGRLRPEEFERMKIHPLVGAEILETVQFPYPVVPIVRAHHERWDGGGYPHRLQGEDIPLGARILAAVDALDALVRDRHYRIGLPLEQAMKVLETQSGKSFDPRVIAALRMTYLELERTAQSVEAAVARSGVSGPESAIPASHSDKRAESPETFIGSIAAARQEFQILHELASELGTSLSLRETLSLLALRLRPLIPHHAIAIYLRKDDQLCPEYVEGDCAGLLSSLSIPLGAGVSGWVAKHNRPMLNGDPTTDPAFLTETDACLHSALAVPLEGVEGILGVLTLYHRRDEAFTRDHLRILQAVRSKAGLTIENALRFQQVSTSAVTDELTGLPNARSLFLHLDKELARCRRTGESLAVLVVDLDGFKKVNDQYGHLEGNKVLQMTAAGMRACCREYDYVARMGGDEFVLILPGAERDAVITKLHQLEGVARRAGANVCGEDVLSLSVGDAFYPEDGDDVEQLLALADRRMYQMKHVHRSERTVRETVAGT